MLRISLSIMLGVALAMTVPSVLGLTAYAQPAPSHGNMRACSFATRADAKLALGQPVSKGQASTIDVWSSCSFTGTKRVRVFVFQVASTKMVETNHPGQTAADTFNQAKTGQKTVGVKGVGKKAFWLPKFSELWSLKGDVVSSYLGGPKSTMVAAATRIVKRI